MWLSKVKLAVAVLLMLGLIVPASTLAYRGLAGEKPTQKQKQDSRAEQPARDRTEKELQRLAAEAERLRSDIDKLKKQVQKQDRPGKAAAPKLVIAVYSVVGLTGQPNGEGTEATALMRVIGKTVEPLSWTESGGEGSMDYLPEARGLVIRQSAEVHKQVQELLEELRKAQKEKEKQEPKEPGMA
jgi:hypothetical protein